MTADTPSPLVPTLRFPEFHITGEWKRDQIGSIASISKGKGVSKADIAKSGLTPCIRYAELYTHYGEVIREALSHTNVPPEDLVLSQTEDIIVPASGETRADIARAACVVPAGVALGGDLNILRSDLSGRFFSYLLNSPLRSTIARLAQGDTVAHLYPGQLSKVTISYPLPAEQQKIADCLGSLDDLVAAEGRKLDALRQHKQGLMQQLFPQPGETVPLLRFPEFRNAPEWEERELGDVSEVLMCKRIFASQTNPNGGVPFYKIGTLGGEPDAFISKDIFEEYKSKYNFPRPGEILITCSGTVGKFLAYDGSEAYFQDSNIVWIDNPTLEVSNEFLLSILSNVNWSTLNSTTITRIYGPDLRGLAIKFPQNEQEQKRIADCLSVLDDQIGVQARKRETLTRHKQGLLQQLFPSLEAESR